MKKERQRKLKKIHIFYGDFTSAYDHVIREELWNILKQKDILDDEEIKILKFILSNIEISL